MLSPPPRLPLPAMGMAGAQALAQLSVIPALPRLVSAPRTQTARGSVSDFSGSPHTSAFLLHAPVPVKYSRHSSLPHQHAAKSLSLSLLIMIWKMGKTTCSLLTKSVLPHYRGKEGERGREETMMQKNNLRNQREKKRILSKIVTPFQWKHSALLKVNPRLTCIKVARLQLFSHLPKEQFLGEGVQQLKCTYSIRNVGMDCYSPAYTPLPNYTFSHSFPTAYKKNCPSQGIIHPGNTIYY